MPPISMQPSLRKLSKECRDLFTWCRSIPGLPSDTSAWLENRQAHFRWWAFGLNVDKLGRSSLDARVENHDDVRQILTDLLLSLSSALSKYRSLLQRAQLSLRGEDLALSDSSSSLSVVSDLSSSDGEEPHRPRFAAQQLYVECCLRQLAYVSLQIQRSGEKFRHKRADNDLQRLEQLTPLPYVEFRFHLQTIASIGPQEQLLLARLDVATDQGEIPRSLRVTARAWIYSRRLGPIQLRLIQANVIRRHRMLFSRRRSAPVASNTAKPTPLRKQAAETRLAPPRPLPAAPSITSQALEATPSESPIPFRQPPSEARTATAIGPDLNLDVVTRPTKAHSTLSKLTRVGQSQQYPSCSVLKKSPQCPYCGFVLEQEYWDSEKKFGGHVKHDLAPYTCIFEECDTPYGLYVTREQWIEHLKSDHSVTRWLCSSCPAGDGPDSDSCFSTVSEYRGHILHHHGDDFSPEELPLLIELGEHSVVAPVSCPLCPNGPTVNNIEQDEHIADHLHDFSLLALPWDHDLNDVAVSASSGDSSQPPAPPQPPDDTGPHDDLDPPGLDTKRKDIIRVLATLKAKQLAPESELDTNPFSKLTDIVASDWLWETLSLSQMKEVAMLLDRLEGSLEQLNVDGHDDSNWEEEVKANIAADTEILETCLQRPSKQDYELWEEARKTLSTHFESGLQALINRSSDKPTSLPVLLGTLLQAAWGLQSACIQFGDDMGTQIAEEIVEALQHAGDDESIFLWPHTANLPWSAILAVIKELRLLVDKGEVSGPDQQRRSNLFWSLRLTLHAVNRGRLYGLAYVLSNTPEDEYAALLFTLQDLYRGLLELLVTASASSSASNLSLNLNIGRVISNPLTASGIVKKLYDLVQRLDEAVVRCKEKRVGPVDPEVVRSLDDIPRVRFETLSSSGDSGEISSPDAERTEEDDEKDMELLDWLSTLPHARYHRNIQKKRVEGTCNWFIQRAEFESWLHGSQSACLWLRGSFGSGKTFLTSRVIDYLQVQTSESAESFGLAYYYCAELNESDRQTAVSLLRSLLVQLATYDDDNVNRVANALRTFWEEARLSATELNASTCVEWLVTAINLHQQTTLVLDGVDKLTKTARRDLFDSLGYLFLWCTTPVKIFLSSCDVVQLVAPMEPFQGVVYTVSLSHWNSGDETENLSHTYVDMRRVLGAELGADADPTQIQDLLDRSEGCFLWAIAQARSQIGRSGTEAIDASFHNARLTYQQLRNGAQTFCKYAFVLIAYSNKTFTNHELFRALALCSFLRIEMTEGEPLLLGDTVTSGDIDTQERWLRHLWPEAFFLDLNNESSEWKLTHKSLIDYVEKDSAFNWDRTGGSAAILHLCLSLMGYQPLPIKIEDLIPSPEHPVSVYARHYWPRMVHGARVNTDSYDSKAIQALRSFFGFLTKGSPTYQRWLGEIILDVDRGWPAGSYFTQDVVKALQDRAPIAAMCHASLFGFLEAWLNEPNLDISELNTDVLADVGECAYLDDRAIDIGRRLLDLGVDVNQSLKRRVGSRSHSALAHAVRESTSGWVELLLSQGADISSDLSGVASAMIAAVAKRQHRTVELLLTRGLTPDAGLADDSAQSALLAASGNGDLEMVEKLVRAGADVNRRLAGDAVASALAAAALNEDAVPVLELLINSGASIHMQGGDYGSPLAAACAVDNIEAATLLIAHGADVNQAISTRRFGSALIAAASNNCQRCLRVLIRAGAHIDQDTDKGEYKSALIAAASNGSLDCLLDIINAGADENRAISAETFSNSITAAAGEGHLGCLRALVDTAANRSHVSPSLDRGLASALLAAASNGRSDCLEALIEYGANADGEMALFNAMYGGSVKCIHILLQTGVDVNQPIRDGIYGSALGIAAGSGNREVLEALISAGADVNIVHQPPAEYGTPLIAAVARRKFTCIGPLARAGAIVDREVSVGNFSTALAANVWVTPYSQPCLELLAQAGANLDAPVAFFGERPFDTALIAAAYLGRHMCARYLVKEGADAKLRIQGGRFRDAMEAAMTAVTAEDANIFDTSVVIWPGVIPSKGLVKDKETIVELLRQHSG